MKFNQYGNAVHPQGNSMGIFDFRKEEEARLRKLKELVKGCERHPSYRYKKAPTSKCKRCLELFDFATQLKEWDARQDEWWKSYHAVEREVQEEAHRAREEWLNCPG